MWRITWKHTGNSTRGRWEQVEQKTFADRASAMQYADELFRRGNVLWVRGAPVEDATRAG